MSPADALASEEAVVAEALLGWPIQSHGFRVAPAVTDPHGLWCQLEGRQGRSVRVRLLALRPDESVALIRIEPTWQLLEMPLARITRLFVDSDLAPTATAPRSVGLSLKAAPMVKHAALAAAEHPLGLFLVTQASDGATWRRMVYPHTSYASLVWGPPPQAQGAPCRSADELRLALRIEQARDARQPNPPCLDLDQYPVHRATVERLPYSRARQLQVLPVGLLDGALVVVMDDPSRLDPLPELGFLFGTRIVAVRPARHSTLHLLNEWYSRWGLSAQR